MGIDLDNIMLSEMSEKDKNCIISLIYIYIYIYIYNNIYGISKIIQIDIYIKQKQTYRYRTSGYQ